MNHPTRTMTDENRRKAESYIANIRRGGLKADVKVVIDGIEKQLSEEGWISAKQLDVLRRCSLRTNMPNPMGGFKSRVCYGR